MSITNNILNRFNLNLTRIFPRAFERFAVQGKNLIGVEIGVYRGEHAVSLLKNLDIKKLYLIDPYQSYQESRFYSEEHLFSCKIDAEINIIPYSGKVKWINKKSEDCLKEIPNKLDFVYIDGKHDYESVKQDIKNYYPKLKVGGVLGGHDFYNANCPEHNDVIDAVIEFVTKNKLKLIVGGDWWIIK